MEVSFVSHPLLRSGVVERRLYQEVLAGEALRGSSLVVLPTGLGKTVVALLVMVERLGLGKVLFLAPTKPLVEQHAAFLRGALVLGEGGVVVFTGGVPPARRALEWGGARVVVATPQVVENDLLARRIDLGDVSLVVFDEAHRGVGDYAYVYIAEKYFEQARFPLALGITASPGGDVERIAEVQENLGLGRVLARSESDPDVRPYVSYRRVERRVVRVPVEIKGLGGLMGEVLSERLGELERLGYVLGRRGGGRVGVRKMEVLDLQRKLQGRLRFAPDRSVYQAVSLLAEVLKLNHALELAETQGVSSLKRYFERLSNEARSRGSKAAVRLMADPRIRTVVEALSGLDIEHPKIEEVREIVGEEVRGNPDSRVIVFTNYRDTAEMVVEALRGVEGVRPVRFVGQASRYRDKGLTQREQVEILEKFRSGEYNTLVATSVAEEGLDIPATDLVLFYEPVPSEIRSIQRKGRTGRRHQGRVVVLITDDTLDNAYHWSSRHREKKMHRQIQALQQAGEGFSGGRLHKEDSGVKIDVESGVAKGEVGVEDGKVGVKGEEEIGVKEGEFGVKGEEKVGVEESGMVGVRGGEVVEKGEVRVEERGVGVMGDGTSRVKDGEVEVKSVGCGLGEEGVGVEKGVGVKEEVSGGGQEFEAGGSGGAGVSPEEIKVLPEETGVSPGEIFEGGAEKKIYRVRGGGSEAESISDGQFLGGGGVTGKGGGVSVPGFPVETMGGVFPVETKGGKGHREEKTQVQRLLLDFKGDDVRVYVDSREARCRVVKELERCGVELVFQSLEVGDYVLSERVGVERKTTADLLESLINPGRELFRQLSDLARNYERPILVVEGEDLYTARQVHPNAIQGLLASIIVDFRIPVFFTKNEEETASLLRTIARREQKEGKKHFSLHGKRTALTLPEQQEYVVSSIAGIGPSTARNLLKHFGTIEKIVTATREELLEVESVGPKTANKIREIVTGKYKG